MRVPANRGRLGQRTVRCVVGRVLPANELRHAGGDLLQQRPHLDAAGDRDIRAAFGSPGDVARELDDVAKSLIGHQQQPTVRQSPAIPLRLAGRRHQRCRTADAEAPFVFVPTFSPLAAQQQRLSTHEMRPGQARIDTQCASGAVKCRVKFHPVIVDDGLVVQAQRIGRRQRGGTTRGIKRLIQPTHAARYTSQILRR